LAISAAVSLELFVVSPEVVVVPEVVEVVLLDAEDIWDSKAAICFLKFSMKLVFTSSEELVSVEELVPVRLLVDNSEFNSAKSVSNVESLFVTVVMLDMMFVLS
jgi:hypothetical protein